MECFARSGLEMLDIVELGCFRKTLQIVASHSAPGSSLVLDYANSLGFEGGKLNPNGPGGIPTPWQEPWIFGTPGADGRFFSRAWVRSGSATFDNQSRTHQALWNAPGRNKLCRARLWEVVERNAGTPPSSAERPCRSPEGYCRSRRGVLAH